MLLTDVDNRSISCESMPCFNNATCVDLDDSYNCTCPLGYVGERCENVSSISCESMPCFNNATCVDLDDGYDCTCPLGYVGERCENVSCAAVSCDNGGHCSEDGVSWWCSCPPQFEGVSLFRSFSHLLMRVCDVDSELSSNLAAVESML